MSLLVSDRYQGLGIGIELVRRLIDAAKHEKIKRIIAVMSRENESMQNLCRKTGFSSFSSIDVGNNMVRFCSAIFRLYLCSKAETVATLIPIWSAIC